MRLLPDPSAPQRTGATGALLPVVLASLLLIGPGCSGRDTGDPGAEDAVSKIYDVPLHKSAIRDTAKGSDNMAVYLVELPINGLANFYTVAAKMGDTMRFKDLDWCSGSRKETPPREFERVWRKPSAPDFLVLRGTEKGNASQLSITEERGNATRTCSAGI